MEEKNVQLLDSEKDFQKKNINNPVEIEYENQNLEREKERLLNIFNRIGKELTINPEEDIRETYKEYANVEIKKKKIVKGPINRCKIFFFKAFLIMFSSVYLIGMFIIISIKNSLWDLCQMSFFCKIKKFCDKDEFYKRANFFKYFFDKTLYQPIDFGLVMFWNLIGFKMIKSCGFRKTIIIFFFLNVGILLLLYNLDFTDFDPVSYNHGIGKIIILFLVNFAMSICFGAITLLSQQRISDYSLILSLSLSDKNENEDNAQLIVENQIEEMDNINSINFENNEDKDSIKKDDKSNKSKSNQSKKITRENKISSFPILCSATFIGYGGKSFVFYLFSNIRDNKQENIDYNNNTYYNNSDHLNNVKDDHFKYFIDKNSSINDEFINKEILDINEDLFLDICYVFMSCMIISFIIYLLFLSIFIGKKKKNKTKNEKTKNQKSKKKCCCSCLNCCKKFLIWKCACELCGCILYSERIKIKENTSKGNAKLLCETCQNYCNNALCNLCKCGDENKNCCKCGECCDYNEEDFDKNKQCYFYCYQEKSFFHWLNEFITNDTQKEIIPCMILYLMSKLIIIAYEKEYKDLYNNNDFEDIYLTDMTISFAISITIYITSFCVVGAILNKYRKKKKTGGFFEKIFINSNEVIVEALALNYENAFIAFGGSLIKYFGTNRINPIKKKRFDFIILYSTIFLNKYFICSLNFYCSSVVEIKKGLEILLSQSTLITIYLNIINFIISTINDITPNIKGLYIIQTVFSGITFLILYLISLPYLVFYCIK